MYLLLMSEQSFNAVADLRQQMLVQMVYTRDVNQLSSQAELALTLVIKTLMLQNRVSAQTRTSSLDERHFLLTTGS